MKNFIEWCQEKGLALEACHKEPVRAGTKVKGGKNGDTMKYSGNVRKYMDDLEDYKGNYGMNGTVDPFEVKAKGKSGKPVADVGK